jgi:hypothetical protein
MDPKKECKYCGITKESCDFRKNRLKCKDCEREHGRNYRQSNDKAKIWVENNKVRMQELQSNWHQSNKDKINAKYNKRYQEEPEFKIKKNTHRRLLALINKDDSTKTYLGTEYAFVKEWLQYCFTENMTWENHGEYWHIDHVIPLNAFNLSNKSEQLIAFNWKNLMPYEKTANIEKHDKIIPTQIKVHYMNLKKFHKLNKLKIDPFFKELYAKYLVAGTPLEL